MTEGDLSLYFKIVAGVYGPLVILVLGFVLWYAHRIKRKDAGFHVARPFYGDIVETDPDAGTVTREGRRNG